MRQQVISITLEELASRLLPTGTRIVAARVENPATMINKASAEDETVLLLKVDSVFSGEVRPGDYLIKEKLEDFLRRADAT